MVGSRGYGWESWVMGGGRCSWLGVRWLENLVGWGARGCLAPRGLMGLPLPVVQIVPFPHLGPWGCFWSGQHMSGKWVAWVW